MFDAEAYQQARAWLAARPDFELRRPEELAAARFPLERPWRLLEALGRPDRRYRIALIAGTKGKGSTAAILAALLRAHGQRVGLYTQPHLHTPRERLRVDDTLISPAELAAAVTRVRPLVETLDADRPDLGRLTTFEIMTMLGLDWFARRGVDWAVLEVGLGGRLDATNVVSPDVAIITSISYDHMDVLGRTLGAIAAEKAGIIKPRAVVISAPQRPAALAVIRRTCRRQEARMLVAGQTAGTPRIASIRPRRLAADSTDPLPAALLELEIVGARRDYGTVSVGLAGPHQATNVLVALTALERALPEERISVEAVRAALHTVRWPGRFEVVQTRPTLVLDGAHNGDSAERLAEALQAHIDFERLHLVVGIFRDKDLRGILRPFRAAASLAAVELGHPRARPACEIVRAARRLGIAAFEAPSLRAGLEAVLGGASPRDVVCVTGSLSTVAAARAALGLAGAEQP